MDDSYQVSVHLFKQFQRIRFLEIDQELPIWWPCLLMDLNEMSNLYRCKTTKHGYQSERMYGKVVRKHKMDSYIVG